MNTLLNPTESFPQVKENVSREKGGSKEFLNTSLLPVDLHSQMFSLAERRATRVQERLGKLISSSGLPLPYDYGTPLQTVSINLFNGDPTPFFGILGQADKVNGELNLAVLMGKWFKWNYNPLEATNTTFISNSSKSELRKTVRFTPFNRAVFAVARITATLPSNPILIMFTGEELTGSFLQGIQADFSCSLSYFDGVNSVEGTVANEMLIRSVKVNHNAEVGYVFKPIITASSLLRLPANYSEINFNAQLIGQAFTSGDVNQLMNNGNFNQYALAMLDLRNTELHANTPIIINPLSNEIWNPSGGLKLNVTIEFYEVDNIMTH